MLEIFFEENTGVLKSKGNYVIEYFLSESQQHFFQFWIFNPKFLLCIDKAYCRLNEYFEIKIIFIQPAVYI